MEEDKHKYLADLQQWEGWLLMAEEYYEGWFKNEISLDMKRVLVAGKIGGQHLELL